MENAETPGPGKKPQKKTPARPSPTRKPASGPKPAPARKPAARKPAPRKPAAKPIEVAEPEATELEATEPEVVETEVTEPEVTEPEAVEPEVEHVPGTDVEAPEKAPATPTFSVPRLTVPTLGGAASALGRASRAVTSRIKAAVPVAPAVVEPEVSEKPVSEETVTEEPATEESVAEAAAEPKAPANTAPTKPARTPRKPRRPAVTAEPVLTVSGLTKRFDETLAVNTIDLVVPVGAFYGIVGPNGAGKTTTLSMITGLLRPDSGTVTVHGADVWANPVVAKRNMGVLPDRLRLFDRLTGSQLLYYSGVLRGLSPAETKKRTADLSLAFGLEDALGRLVSDYSAGMTKKIALAAAMIHSPRLLVLDEPFESVDPVSAATVTDILKNYAAAGGTVLLSSHSMDLVQRICDNVAVVVGGEILADGTMASVRGSSTLEEKFVQLAGGRTAVEGLEWLHTFSD